MVETAGLPLRQLLTAVAEPLVDVLAAPRGFDVDVRDVVILDPEEESGTRAGDLALVIGARGRSAVRLVRAAARDGASAVAVKVETEQEARVLRETAEDGGTALLGVRPEVRWEQLESLARSAVEDARLTTEADAGEALGDLFSLAQTVAGLTDGIVSIEDTADRVLAYSRSDDDVDELRRLSILGRRGPEPFLARLREWGVYQRLRAGEHVVRIDERPELGIRRRMAVGIRAGSQPLGTIWVQEGSHPLAQGCEQALLGAARVASLQLVRQRTQASAPSLRENLLSGLLDGRLDADSVAESIGADPSKPCVVVVFALRLQEHDPGSDRSELELQRSEMTNLISVHAAAYRRSALVTGTDSRVCVLLPDLPASSTSSASTSSASASSAQSAATSLTAEIVSAAKKHPHARVRAGLGSVVASLHEAAVSRGEADRILDAMAHDLGAEIATIADVRSQVLVSELLTTLGEHRRFRDPRLRRLVEHDAEHGAELAGSLLAYLEAFGEVRAASERLHVHPNTLRYRVRRAKEVAGLDLADPSERLNAQLQLLLARRSAPTRREQP